MEVMTYLKKSSILVDRLPLFVEVQVPSKKILAASGKSFQVRHFILSS